MRTTNSLAKWVRDLTLDRFLVASLPIVLAATLRFINGGDVLCCVTGACDEGAICRSYTVWLAGAWLVIAFVLFVFLLRVLSFDQRSKDRERARLDRREQALKKQEHRLRKREKVARREREVARKDIEQGFRSIAMVPNLAVVIDEYRDHFREVHIIAEPYVLENALWTSEMISDPVIRLEEIGERLRASLNIVAQMTRLFGEATGGRRKGSPTINANLMLPFEDDDLAFLPQTYKDQAFLPQIDDADQPGRSSDGLLRFASQNVDISKLDGILVLRADLVATSIGSDAAVQGNLPVMPWAGDICLPVESYPASQTLPGAPSALVRGGISVHRDTATLAAEYKDSFGEPIVLELAHYFSDGPGRHIGSFFSVRLGNRAKPIAILSVDSSATNLIGTTDDQSKAFLALLVPMLAALSPMADLYAKVWRQVLRLNPDAS